MPNWAKEEACFHGKKDMNGNEWPRIKPSDQLSYENWLMDVVNPQTHEYYLHDEGNGEFKSAHYDVTTIIRYRDVDNKEYLLSQGTLIGYTSFGDPVTHAIRHPEQYQETIFTTRTAQDPHNQNRMITVTSGPAPGASKLKYMLPFNKANLQKLVDQRASDNVQFLVQEGANDESRSIQFQKTIEATVKLFGEKEFDYLKNALYMPFEVRERNRAAAEAQGLIDVKS